MARTWPGTAGERGRSAGRRVVRGPRLELLYPLLLQLLHDGVVVHVIKIVIVVLKARLLLVGMPLRKLCLALLLGDLLQVLVHVLHERLLHDLAVDPVEHLQVRLRHAVEHLHGR